MVSHMATGVHKEVYVVDQRRAVPSARGAREAPLQHRKTDSAGTVMVMELLMDDDIVTDEKSLTSASRRG